MLDSVPILHTKTDIILPYAKIRMKRTSICFESFVFRSQDG